MPCQVKSFFYFWSKICRIEHGRVFAECCCNMDVTDVLLCHYLISSKTSWNTIYNNVHSRLPWTLLWLLQQCHIFLQQLTPLSTKFYLFPFLSLLPLSCMCPSLCPSAPTEWFFMKFYICGFFSKILGENSSCTKPEKYSAYLTRLPKYFYDKIWMNSY